MTPNTATRLHVIRAGGSPWVLAAAVPTQAEADAFIARHRAIHPACPLKVTQEEAEPYNILDGQPQPAADALPAGRPMAAITAPGPRVSPTEQTAMANRYIADRANYRAELQARLEAYRQLKRQPHTLKPGDVVVNSWGYDQTNVDFYQVTRTTAHFVWVRKLKAKTTETGFMAGPTSPLLGQFDDTAPAITKHKGYMAEDGQPRVKFEYGAGWKWDGKPEHCSWYA